MLPSNRFHVGAGEPVTFRAEIINQKGHDLEKVHFLLIIRMGELMLRLGGHLWRLKNVNYCPLLFSERNRFGCKVWQIKSWALTYRFDGGKGKR